MKKEETKQTTRRGALLGIGAAAVAAAAACRAKPPLVPEVVVGPAAGALPSRPDDRVWRKAPMHVARLLLQDMVEPRLMAPSTPDVSVQALTDGTRVAFRLAWMDAEHDEVSAPARFPDACAVQLPSVTAPDVPAPQMGEPGRPVEITLWRASWQAAVEGRRGSIRDVYPNAATDHYPFEAASLASHGEARRAMARRYAPAEAVGNPMAGPRATPVEDLLAEGPGSLTHVADRGSTGTGTRTDGGWAVVITRPLPPGLTPNARTQVAFAVWQGSKEETGARKMRTGWVPLRVEARA